MAKPKPRGRIFKGESGKKNKQTKKTKKLVFFFMYLVRCTYVNFTYCLCRRNIRFIEMRFSQLSLPMLSPLLVFYLCNSFFFSLKTKKRSGLLRVKREARKARKARKTRKPTTRYQNELNTCVVDLVYTALPQASYNSHKAASH